MNRKDEEENNTINQTSTYESIFVADIPITRQSNKSKNSASSNINNDPAAKSSPQTTTSSNNKDNAAHSINNSEIEEEQTIEDKTQPDIYEDIALLKYIKTLESGLSKKQVRRSRINQKDINLMKISSTLPQTIKSN